MNFKGNVGSNSFEWKQPEWTYKPNKELSELGACEWSCPKDYLLSGNDCKLPKL
jgi:hypothetical protein